MTQPSPHPLPKPYTYLLFMTDVEAPIYYIPSHNVPSPSSTQIPNTLLYIPLIKSTRFITKNSYLKPFQCHNILGYHCANLLAFLILYSVLFYDNCTPTYKSFKFYSCIQIF